MAALRFAEIFAGVASLALCAQVFAVVFAASSTPLRLRPGMLCDQLSKRYARRQKQFHR